MNSKKHWPSMFMKKSSTSPDNPLPEMLNSSAMTLPYSEGASSHNYVLERARNPPKPRTRWIPKSEQIGILEAIFNSGMVNPPREEIRRIRAQLEKFGEVGEASVYYWFQNRKSKVKRRQRQLQAVQRSKSNAETGIPSSTSSTASTSTSTSVKSKPMTDLSNSRAANNIHNNIGDQFYSSAELDTSFAGHDYDLQAMYDEMGKYNELSNMQAIGAAHDYDLQAMYDEMANYNGLSNMQAIGTAVAAGGQGISNEGTGVVQDSVINPNPLITVFINDNPIQVPMGPINVRAFFGDNVLLFRSSGEFVTVNEWGFTSEGLEHGAKYFLM